VLYPHALQLPEGIKGNIFQTPAPDSDYLVAMIDPDRFSSNIYPRPETTHDIFRYDRWPKIHVPDSLALKYCYLLSGDYKGINQDTIYRDSGIKIKIPAHRVSSLIQLSKEPRYEITRTSSPVLTRGDTEKFEVKVQNTEYNGTKWYGIVLTTPFGLSKHDTFSLQHDSIRKVVLNLVVVPRNFPLGEITMKVIDSSKIDSEIEVDTIVFTAWVVDLLTFQLPERPFIHSGKWSDTIATTISGDTIPFILVNNTNRTLMAKLKGSFKHYSGLVKFGTPPSYESLNVILRPLEDTILVAYFAPDSIIDTVQILGIVSAE
jgi:hypothetical protein